MKVYSTTLFRQALHHPKRYFRTLGNLVYEQNSLRQTSLFAEAVIHHEGRAMMLYVPTIPEALEQAASAMEVIYRAKTPISSLHMLPDELVNDFSTRPTSLLTEEIDYEAITLSEALYVTTKAHLIWGMERLKRELRRANISHNHLHTNNILVSEDYTWHPIRCYYTSAGYGGDEEAFKEIEALIDAHAIDDHSDTRPILKEDYLQYITNTPSDHSAFLAKDFNQEVTNLLSSLPYATIDNFVEGRAVVITRNGKMGMIDYDGNEVLKPIYDKIIFMEDDGSSRVYRNGRIAIFDYDGKRITTWMALYSRI